MLHAWRRHAQTMRILQTLTRPEVGGGASATYGLTTSILEVPTYTLAIVFLFFCLLSILFEWTSELIEHALAKRNRIGLLTAFRKLIMELTLLGFVSLILILFQSSLTKICVNYSHSMADWTLLQNVDGCPCCLEHMDVSLCGQMYQECSFSSSEGAPYCGCENSTAPVLTPDSSHIPPEDEAYCVAYNQLEAQFAFDMVESSVDIVAELTNETTVQVLEDIVNRTLNGTIPSESPLETTHSRRLLLSDRGTELGSDLILEIQPPTPLDHHRRLAAQDEGNATAILSEEGTHILPNIKVFTCEGPFLQGDCPAGQVPALSNETLHQLHLWIFLIAIFHVLCGLAMILLAEWRLRQWRVWQARDLHRAASLRQISLSKRSAALPPLPNDLVTVELEETLSRTPSSGGASSVKELQLTRSGSGRVIGAFGSVLENDHDASDGHDAELAASPPPPDRARTVDTAISAGARSPEKSGASMLHQGIRAHPSHNADLDIPPSPKFAIMRFLGRWQRQFERRETRIESHTSWFLEALIWVAYAFHPTMIGQQEFRFLRESYMASHDLDRPLDFVTLTRQALEMDAAGIVGLSVEMWVVVVILVLTSGLVGWIGSLFGLLSAIGALVLNVALVASVRHRCRGGRANRFGARKVSSWWRGGAWAMTITIRMISFLCSLIFSTDVLFVWQFGAGSCYFSNDVSLFGFSAFVPWWGAVVFGIVTIAWLGLVTLPTYSLLRRDSPSEVAEKLGGDAPLFGKDSKEKHPDRVVSARQVSMLVAQLDGETVARQQAEAALAADRQTLLDEQQRLETWAKQLEERERALGVVSGNDVP